VTTGDSQRCQLCLMYSNSSVPKPHLPPCFGKVVSSCVPIATVQRSVPGVPNHYRPGFERYRCKDCGRTFNDLTKTPLSQGKRSLPHWILATFLLCLSCSSRCIARDLGVHVNTSYRWCWWLRNAALSYGLDRQLEGCLEADELYHTAYKLR